VELLEEEEEEVGEEEAGQEEVEDASGSFHTCRIIKDRDRTIST